jgi:hypothetical protein
MADANDRKRDAQHAQNAPRTREPDEKDTRDERTPKPNPPRTVTDGIAAPKFGSAGSGGAEIEPGPEAD